MGLFNLIFNLGINQTEFRRGMKQSVDHVGTSANAMSRHLGENGPIGGAISQLKHQLLGMVGLHMFTHAIHQTVAYASTINDMSAATGVSTERLQELDHALKMTGSSMEDGVKAIRKLALAREEALQNPDSKAAKSFTKFGITPEKLAATEDPSDLFLMLGDAVKGVAMDTDSLAAMLDLVGARNSAVIPAMIEGLREAGESAHTLGLIISDDNIKALDEAEDSVAKLTKAFTAGLAPAIAAVAHWIMEMGDQIKIVVNGALAAIESLRSTGLFGGKGLKANLNRAGEASGEAMNETLTEMEDEKIKERENKVRKKFNLEDIQDKAEKKAAQETTKEAEKQLHLQEQIHASKLQQMKPAERLKQLQQDRSDFAVKAFDAAGAGDLSLEDQARLGKFDADIASLSGGGKGDKLSRDRSDSLTSIGNFLGGAPDPAIEKLQTMGETLKSIQADTSKLSNNAISFS